MALIKHANAQQLARQAIVLDLGDLSRQGRQIIEQARAKAEELLAEARAERDRIIAGAAEKGRADGMAQGLELGRKKGREEGNTAALTERRAVIDQLEAAWRTSLEEFAAQRQVLLNQAHIDVLRLAALIAGRVVKRVIELDPRVVEDQMRAVLATVTRPSELLIRVHPEDLEVARQALPALLAAFESVRDATLAADPALPRGSCVSTARAGTGNGIGGGEVDASIDTQLSRIIEAILPGSDAAPSSTGAQP